MDIINTLGQCDAAVLTALFFLFASGASALFRLVVPAEAAEEAEQTESGAARKEDA